MKKITVYLSGYFPHGCWHTMGGSLHQIKIGADEIHTTYTGLLDFRYLEMGYELYFNAFGCTHACVLGLNTWMGNKDIRATHNLEKMVRACVYSRLMG